MKNKKMKKVRLLDLKDELLTSTSRLCKVFDSLNEKDSLLLLKKINAFVKKPKKSENSASKEVQQNERFKSTVIAPVPAAKPVNPMDFSQEEFDAYEPRHKHTDSSLSEPFSNSDSDDLNEAINYGDEEFAEMEIVNSIRIRDRFGDKDDFLTDKSIVTKHNLNVPKRIDPFKDEGKILGRYPFQANPYSNAPSGFKKLETIQELDGPLVSKLNSDGYDNKATWRLNELTKIGLKKDKLELKVPNTDVCTERERLDNEYKRYLIDLDRRAQKIPEPNMINTTNGECSDEWRNWFQHRLDQMEAWLVEDAINYHLPPSLECDPPAGLKFLAADWNCFRKNEIEIPWDFNNDGPMVLKDDMAFDGTKLYNPLNGKVWNNIVEHLEDQVKRRWRERFPGSRRNPFDDNGGLFWSQIMQQWYDLLNVSTI